MFSKAFIDLQFTLAERVRVVSGMPLERALFEFTNLYVRFGLGREFDREHAGWRAYRTGLNAARDGRDWTYQFYLDNAEANTMPAVEATFGCFSYAFQDGTQVRLHFRNAEPESPSPLAKVCFERRRNELVALFTRLKATAAEGCVVKGGSWLYNLAAYRRLFPDSYGASSKPVGGRFQSMSLWGQFLDHAGGVKPALRQTLAAALSRLTDLEQLDGCFPFQVLAAEAPAEAFYQFYTV